MIRIQSLVSARKNSKYLAKFVFDYMQKTAHPDGSTPLAISIHYQDQWNASLLEFLETKRDMFVMYDSDNLGRYGLHKYFARLYSNLPSAEWYVYFCEDHNIVVNNWDSLIRAYIQDRSLNPELPYCIVPKFDNAGAMNHILSAGFLKSMEKPFGGTGWVDSYINEVNKHLPKENVIKIDDELFHDFTHDQPNMLDDIHTKVEVGQKTANKLTFNLNQGYFEEMARRDANKINNVIGRAEWSL